MISALFGTAGRFGECLACLGYPDEAYLSQAGVGFRRSATRAGGGPQVRGGAQDRRRKELRLLPTFVGLLGCHAL
jgi:hypothetical protein